MAELLHVERLLELPGVRSSKRRVAVEMAEGRVCSIREGHAEGGDGLLALPAMVNAHDHGYGIRPISQGIVDDALECWIACLKGRISVDPWLESVVAFGRMALSGIGATVHCHNSLAAERLPEEAEAVARAARDIGIRVAFVCPILDRNAWVYGDQRGLLPHVAPEYRAFVESGISSRPPAIHLVDQVEEIARNLESEFFNVQYGPVGPQWCQEATLVRIAENSERYGRRIHMHFLESSRQRQWLDAAYPQGIVRHLDDIGFLSARLGVAHGVHLTEEESEVLASRDVLVSVNTSSNLRLRSGIAPVSCFLRQELRFGLGLDGAAHDDDQDYLRDMRLAFRLHGGWGVWNELQPQDMFRAAHRDGFTFVDGSEDYGIVEEGARADILTLDYGAMTADQVTDGVEELDILLARMRAEHVRDLFVAGRSVVRDGALVGMDLDAAEDDLTKRAVQEAPGLDEEMVRRRSIGEGVRSYYGDWEGSTLGKGR